MAENATVLACPKCAGEMRAYERNGVTIDQCTNCRGVFLDRGELERLIDAESSYYQQPQGTRPQAPPGYVQDSGQGHGNDYGQAPYREGHHGGDKHGDRGEQRRRRGGFLGELFD